MIRVIATACGGALMACACSALRSNPGSDAPAALAPRFVPVRPNDLERVKWIVGERARVDERALAFHWGCAMPLPVLDFEGPWREIETARSVPPPGDPPTVDVPVPKVPPLDEWDLFGVDICAAPSGDGLLVRSRFGSEAGLQRVVDWIAFLDSRTDR